MTTSPRPSWNTSACVPGSPPDLKAALGSARLVAVQIHAFGAYHDFLKGLLENDLASDNPHNCIDSEIADMQAALSEAATHAAAPKFDFAAAGAALKTADALLQQAKIIAAQATLARLRDHPAAGFAREGLDQAEVTLSRAQGFAETDFASARALLGQAVTACSDLRLEMGLFEQLDKAAKLALQRIDKLGSDHPQGDFVRADLDALASDVTAAMDAVRADPARMSASQAAIEAALSRQHEPVTCFSWNTLHEVGHAVDDKLGFMSKRGASLAGWKVYGANVAPIAKILADKFGYDENYIALYMTKRSPKDDNDKVPNPAMPEPDGVDPDEWNRRRTDVEIWIDRARASNQPWQSDSTAKACAFDNVVYHESYEHNWSSYDLGARRKGVTAYQFRAPGEWFSELYACFHTGKMKPTHPAHDWLKDL